MRNLYCFVRCLLGFHHWYISSYYNKKVIFGCKHCNAWKVEYI